MEAGLGHNPLVFTNQRGTNKNRCCFILLTIIFFSLSMVVIPGIVLLRYAAGDFDDEKARSLEACYERTGYDIDECGSYLEWMKHKLKMHVVGIIFVSVAPLSFLAGLLMLLVMCCRPCKTLSTYAHGCYVRGMIILFTTGAVFLVGGMTLFIVANGALDDNKKEEIAACTLENSLNSLFSENAKDECGTMEEWEDDKKVMQAPAAVFIVVSGLCFLIGLGLLLRNIYIMQLDVNRPSLNMRNTLAENMPIDIAQVGYEQPLDKISVA